MQIVSLGPRIFHFELSLCKLSPLSLEFPTLSCPCANCLPCECPSRTGPQTRTLSVLPSPQRSPMPHLMAVGWDWGSGGGGWKQKTKRMKDCVFAAELPASWWWWGLQEKPFPLTFLWSSSTVIATTSGYLASVCVQIMSLAKTATGGRCKNSNEIQGKETSNEIQDKQTKSCYFDQQTHKLSDAS